MKKALSIAIIGTGFSGLCMGIRLKRAGIHSFTLLERADSVGGTWRDNTYPGAACDVPSPLYSFSFEPNPEWSRLFAPQAEIRAYLEHCTDKYGLRPHIRFNASVTSARFDERENQWRLKLGDGEELRADLLVLGTGWLSRPSYPDIPGLDDFRGRVFHSAQWEHDYDFTGKRVAVIGSGASAIQIVPEIAPPARRLHVFQRTPPWILPREDRAIGWLEQKLYQALPLAQRLLRQAIYWRLESRVLALSMNPRLTRRIQREAVRFLERSIPQPELRKKLTPDYMVGCKRVLLSNDYYPTLLRPNVELVTDSIREISPTGVLTKDGTERPVDALVLATGFQAAEEVAPFELRGRGGVELRALWREGAEAYLGTTVAGMPNLFLITGPNTGLGHSSMVLMIESQVQYILECIQKLRRTGCTSLEVREEVQRRYNQRLHTRLAHTVWNAGGCASWYKTRTGKNTALWPGFTFEFRWRTHRLAPSDYQWGRQARERGALRVEFPRKSGT